MQLPLVTPPAAAAMVAALTALFLGATALLRTPAADGHKRGAEVLKGRAARHAARRRASRYAAAVRLAGVALEPREETRHFKLIGTTGTGKSTAIAGLLATALARGDRAIITDPDAGYAARFYQPRRVALMYEEICAGLHQDAREVLQVIPAETHDEMVIVKDIPLYSVCEHHFLPFVGVAHIAYIPRDGRIVGLSKLARVADIMAKKPQIQERLTTEIADLLYKELRATGVMVVIEAEHLCMEMRGVKKPGAKTITSALRGGFLKDPRTRNEAMALIRDPDR